MPDVTYTECDHCGEVIPQGSTMHTARRTYYDTSVQGFLEEHRTLCCVCYRHVGGYCDER